MITDAAHVRTIGNLPQAVIDAMLLPHIRTAARRLAQWVGTSVYTESETEVAAARAELDPGDELDISLLTPQAQALIDAEAYLTLVAALPSLNTVMNDSGGVALSGQAGETQYQYLYPAALKNLIDSYLRDAEIAAEGYIIRADLSPGISRAYDDDGDPIT